VTHFIESIHYLFCVYLSLQIVNSIYFDNWIESLLLIKGLQGPSRFSPYSIVSISFTWRDKDTKNLRKSN